MDWQGFPLTGANVQYSKPFDELLDAVPSVRGKRGRPAKLYVEKAHDFRRCRQACKRWRNKAGITRPGVEARQGLGRRCGVVESTFAWLNRFHRLTIRYERRLDIHHAFSPSQAPSSVYAPSIIAFEVLSKFLNDPC